MRFHLVVNPVAGRRAPASLLHDVARLLEERGHTVTRYETTGPGDAGHHVAGIATDATDYVISVGGDGTLREIVNGRPPPLPWPVGVIALGTANLVARELGMPLTFSATAIVDALCDTVPWPISLLRLDRPGTAPVHAVANVGVGLDAAIVHTIGQIRSSDSGSGGYARWIRPIWETVRAYRFPPMAVTIDGEHTYRASTCIIQNAFNYGGLFRLSLDARMDTPVSDVMLMTCGSTRDLFRVLWGAFRGRAKRDRQVRFRQATQIRLRAARPAGVQADGDPAGDTDVTVTVLPRALRLLHVGPPPARREPVPATP